MAGPPQSVGRLILWLLVLGFGGATFWLAAERNAHRWTLQLDRDQLVVARGRHFVIGEQRIAADDAALGKVYGPIAMPAGMKIANAEFDDQVALDHAIFDTLVPIIGQARTAEETRRAELMLTRLNDLPGLTPKELARLAQIHGDFALEESRADLREAGRLLHEAWRKLHLVEAGNGEHALEAAATATALSNVAAALDELANGRLPGLTPPAAPASGSH